MVHSWVGTYVVQAAGSTGFQVGGAKYQGSDTGIDEGSRAHDAWFEGDHEVAVVQAPTAKVLGRVAQG